LQEELETTGVNSPPLEGLGEVANKKPFNPPAEQVPAIYYYHPDHLGTSSALTDYFGNAYQFFLNLPFGETMVQQLGSNYYNSPYKFNGKELDEETGFYYYGARYYDPRISIWLSVDPLAMKHPDVSPYAYCLNDPVNMVDPDGRDGIRVIDDKNKTIIVRANYYVQTEARTYYNANGRARTLDGYSAKDISKMQSKVNGYLNKDLKSNTVSDGEYKGYKIVYDLQFKEGGTVEQSKEKASKDILDGDSIGNSIERSGSNVTPYFATKEGTPDADGNMPTSIVGGVTQDNKNVTMNSSQDTFMNRVHEIFHTLGFGHAKGTGGADGIMKYPPQDVSQKDINKVANDSFLPKQ
jgi:RHS repeat-associated protein